LHEDVAGLRLTNDALTSQMEKHHEQIDRLERVRRRNEVSEQRWKEIEAQHREHVKNFHGAHGEAAETAADGDPHYSGSYFEEVAKLEESYKLEVLRRRDIESQSETYDALVRERDQFEAKELAEASASTKIDITTTKEL
jgi:hypothetical protein